MGIGKTVSAKRSRLGRYKHYSGSKFLLPSGRKKEIDHQLPHSITSGNYGDKYAVPLHKDQHRRKDTTGSSHWAKSKRHYLLKAQQGFVPYAGKMTHQQDYNAAATSIDIRSSFTNRTLFAEANPAFGEPPIPAKSQQITDKSDAMASLIETKNMINVMHQDGYINDEGKASMLQTAEEVRLWTLQEYNKRKL